MLKKMGLEILEMGDYNQISIMRNWPQSPDPKHF